VPKITLATNQIATAISSKFILLSQQVSTSTANINMQLGLLGTKVGTQVNQISGQFTNLGSTVSQQSQSITQSVQGIQQIAPPAFQQVGQSADQAGQVVQQAGGQISSSVQGASADVQSGTSTMKTSFGQTTQASTQVVTVVDKNTQEINHSMDRAQHDMQQAGSNMVKGLDAVVHDQGQKALDSFLQAATYFGQAAVNVIRADASTIANLLGHSKPKEGPLKDDDLWGKHMVQNIVGGMIAEFPALSAVTNKIAGVMASVQPGAGGGSYAPVIYSGQGANNQPMIVQINLDKKIIGKVAMQYQQKEIHVQAGFKGA
jgi:hypothetical protein